MSLRNAPPVVGRSKSSLMRGGGAELSSLSGAPTLGRSTPTGPGRSSGGAKAGGSGIDDLFSDSPGPIAGTAASRGKPKPEKRRTGLPLDDSDSDQELFKPAKPAVERAKSSIDRFPATRVSGPARTSNDTAAAKTDALDALLPTAASMPVGSTQTRPAPHAPPLDMPESPGAPGPLSLGRMPTLSSGEVDAILPSPRGREGVSPRGGMPNNEFSFGGGRDGSGQESTGDLMLGGGSPRGGRGLPAKAHSAMPASLLRNKHTDKGRPHARFDAGLDDLLPLGGDGDDGGSAKKPDAGASPGKAKHGRRSRTGLVGAAEVQPPELPAGARRPSGGALERGPRGGFSRQEFGLESESDSEREPSQSMHAYTEGDSDASQLISGASTPGGGSQEGSPEKRRPQSKAAQRRVQRNDSERSRGRPSTAGPASGRGSGRSSRRTRSPTGNPGDMSMLNQSAGFADFTRARSANALTEGGGPAPLSRQGSSASRSRPPRGVSNAQSGQGSPALRSQRASGTLDLAAEILPRGATARRSGSTPGAAGPGTPEPSSAAAEARAQYAEETLGRVRAELEDAQKQLSLARADVEELRGRSGAAQRDVETLRQDGQVQRRRHEEEIKELREKHRAAMEERDQAHQRAMQIQRDEVAALRKQHAEDLAAQRRTVEQELLVVEKQRLQAQQVQELAAQLGGMSDRMRGAEAGLSSEITRVLSEREERVRRREAELLDRTREVGAREAAADALRAQLDDLAASLRQRSAQADEALRSQQTALAAERTRLQALMATLNEERATAAERAGQDAAAAARDRAAREAERRAAQAAVESDRRALAKERAEAQSAVEAARNEEAALRREMAGLEARCRRLRETAQKEDRELRAVQEGLAAEKRALAASRVELADEREGFQEQVADLMALAAAVEAQSGEVAATRAALATEQRRLEERKREILEGAAAAEGAAAEIAAEREALDAREAALQRARAELTAERREVTAERLALSRQAQALAQARTALHDQASALMVQGMAGMSAKDLAPLAELLNSNNAAIAAASAARTRLVVPGPIGGAAATPEAGGHVLDGVPGSAASAAAPAVPGTPPRRERPQGTPVRPARTPGSNKKRRRSGVDAARGRQDLRGRLHALLREALPSGEQAAIEVTRGDAPATSVRSRALAEAEEYLNAQGEFLSRVRQNLNSQPPSASKQRGGRAAGRIAALAAEGIFADDPRRDMRDASAAAAPEDFDVRRGGDPFAEEAHAGAGEPEGDISVS
ncbi:unnamed protein product [Pedinophyceae sp. YPF-701]|nr:unnamed protein product [Pedinophyceae sp. YPF-701]